MIPKIIHQIWLGPNPLPELEKHWIQTWKNHHPTWEHRLWTNDDLPKDIPHNCVQTIESVYPKYALIADVYRYIILSQHGGVYIDTDIECYRPIDTLTNVDFLGIMPHENCNYITNAFFGCMPNSKILTDCVANLSPVSPEHFKHAYACIGPSFLTKYFCINNNFNLSKNVLQDSNFDNATILDCSNWYDISRNATSYMKHFFRASHINITK